MAYAGDAVPHVLHERDQQPPRIEQNRGSKKEGSGTKRGHNSCTVAWDAIHNNLVSLTKSSTISESTKNDKAVVLAIRNWCEAMRPLKQLRLLKRWPFEL
jgi:hypothetical protein